MSHWQRKFLRSDQKLTLDPSQLIINKTKQMKTEEPVRPVLTAVRPTYFNSPLVTKQGQDGEIVCASVFIISNRSLGISDKGAGEYVVALVQHYTPAVTQRLGLQHIPV